MIMDKHLFLREFLRNYTAFEGYCSQSGKYDISHSGYTINFLDLQGCLKKLSKRKKEAVFWNVIMDKKQKEVAELMEITTGSVAQYVEQAMVQVAKELWPDEE